jgi:hypothetical protein
LANVSNASFMSGLCEVLLPQVLLTDAPILMSDATLGEPIIVRGAGPALLQHMALVHIQQH